jgi:hypothetical protein
LIFTGWVQEKGKGRSSEEKSRQAVLGIRIRMVFGLPDPDSLVRGTDLDPSSHEGVERSEIMLVK